MSRVEQWLIPLRLLQSRNRATSVRLAIVLVLHHSCADRLLGEGVSVNAIHTVVVSFRLTCAPFNSFVYKYWSRTYRPKSYHIIQEVRNGAIPVSSARR